MSQPNEALLDLNLLTLLALGYPVEKPAQSCAAGGTIHLFTISGGRVAIKSLVGQVTTIMQVKATTMKITATPTVGSAVDLCATSDMTGKEAGALVSIAGLAATALIMNLAGATQIQHSPVVVATGYLDMILGDTNTGAIKWQLRYVPIDDGARVVAA